MFRPIKFLIQKIVLIFLLSIPLFYVKAGNIFKYHPDSTTNTKVEDKKEEEDKKYTMDISLKYGNNMDHNGRKMAKDEPYLMPAFNFSHSCGFYSGISAAYIMANKKKPLDKISLNLGYDKELGDFFSVGIDYTYSHYFSNKELNSSNPHDLSINSSWFNTIISPTLSAAYSFGETSDITLSLDLTHVFSFKNLFTPADKLSIPLIIGSYAGTSNFYVNYTKKNSITDSNGNVIDASSLKTSFNITSIYFLPALKYKISFFSIGGSVNLMLPINQPKKIVKNNHPLYSAEIAFEF